MEVKKIPWFRLSIASCCLILAIINFFSGHNLTPLIFSLASILMILNGLEIIKNKTQAKKMGFFYLGVGVFLIIVIVITTFKITGF
jgi:hypothetical protein